ncbi:MAG: NUDIX domain-containing protein [Planctomycetota bacterium]
MHVPPFTHAGGIVVRRDPDARALVLVVRPTRGASDKPNEWVLPKGHIEAGEETEAAALREVAEEAGVRGSQPRYVGYTAYSYGGEDVACAYYLMDDAGAVPTEEDRPCGWLTLEEIRPALPYPETIALIERALAWAP